MKFDNHTAAAMNLVMLSELAGYEAVNAGIVKEFVKRFEGWNPRKGCPLEAHLSEALIGASVLLGRIGPAVGGGGSDPGGQLEPLASEDLLAVLDPPSLQQTCLVAAASPEESSDDAGHASPDTETSQLDGP